MSSSLNTDPEAEQYFTPYRLDGATLWTRIKFGWSLLTMPFAIALTGRSIRIRMESPEGWTTEDTDSDGEST